VTVGGDTLALALPGGGGGHHPIVTRSEEDFLVPGL
jgi:hypothetical protein